MDWFGHRVAVIRYPPSILISLQWRVLVCYYKPFYSIQGFCDISIFRLVLQLVAVFYLWGWRVAIFPTARYQHRHIMMPDTFPSFPALTRSQLRVRPGRGARALTMVMNGYRFTLGGKQQLIMWRLRGGMMVTSE